MDNDFGQLRDRWLQSHPYPFGQSLACRIFETRYIVQIAMIEGFEDRGERRLDVCEVHDPSGLRPQRTRYVHLNAEGVSVQPRALVSGRHVGKPVCRFDLEYLEYVHVKIVVAANRGASSA